MQFALNLCRNSWRQLISQWKWWARHPQRRFALTDKIGLLVSSPSLFEIARDAARVEVKTANRPNLLRGLTAVVFSAASLEALVNEVTCEAEIEVRSARADGPLQSWEELLEAFVEAMLEVERSRGSTQLKFIVASRVLAGPVYRRGAQPYQDFALLMDLRNAIMHMRPATIVGTVEDWQLQGGAFLKELQARALVSPPPAKAVGNPLDAVSQPLVARWAVNTAAGGCATNLWVGGSYPVEQASQNSSHRPLS